MALDAALRAATGTFHHPGSKHVYPSAMFIFTDANKQRGLEQKPAETRSISNWETHPSFPPLTFNVMPSCTYRSSVSNHLLVTVSLISPFLSTAYRGPSPSLISHICFKVMQPPRVRPLADSMYIRSDEPAYRTETSMLLSQLGLEMALFGELVSFAVVS